MQSPKYFHIKDGQIVDFYDSLAEAHKAERKYNRADCELIDSEEKMYRTVAWCNNNGFDYTEILSDDDGEFCFEQVENYAHPTDEGASVDTTKVRVTYFSTEPALSDEFNF